MSQARADATDLFCMECVPCGDGSKEDEVNDVRFEDLGWEKCWDDVTSRELKRDMVEAARAEELCATVCTPVWPDARVPSTLNRTLAHR